MTMLFRLSCLALLALTIHLRGAESESLHYWNGIQRVEVTLALDRLVVSGAANGALARARTAGAAEGAERGEGAVRQASLRFAARVDRRGLEEHARALAGVAGIIAVRGVLVNDGEELALGRRIAVRLAPGRDVAALAARLRLMVVEQVNYSSDTWVLEATDVGLTAALDAANRLYEVEGAIFATPLVAKRHWARAVINDPLFGNQWHLENSGQSGGVVGSDVNVGPAWGMSFYGAGINIAIVDDGLQTDHQDLTAHIRTDIDIDINYGDLDPAPATWNEDDNHGTFVAGLAGANDNTLGGRGVAPRAGLVAVRLISAPATDQDDANAMNHQVAVVSSADQVHVSSNSWGPSDYNNSLGGPGPLMLAALANGVATGRSGRGVVYVWAGGNGRRPGGPTYDDNSNYDAMANSRYVIAVGALSRLDTQASYSESGANLLVCAPGGPMVSADRSGNSPNAPFNELGFVTGPYSTTGTFSSLVGTSFATPLVSGGIALALEANPALTWRDVQHLLVRTSVQNDSADGSWLTNGAARKFSHRYGFGRVNVAALVTSSSPATWITAPAEETPITVNGGGGAITDNSTIASPGITIPLVIPAAADFRVEHVELQVDVTHTRRGDLHFELESPNGTRSDIPRRSTDSAANFSNWTFTSVAHWGERPNGTWRLRIADEQAGNVGSLVSCRIVVHGYRDYPTPTLNGLSPQGAVTGSGNTPLTVTGSGFVPGVSQIRWDGTPLTTTVVNANQMTATIPSASLTPSGTHTITATNRDFENGAVLASSGMTFTVGAAPAFVTINGAAVPVAGQSTNEDTAKVFTVVISDADTAANLLVLSGTSSNQAVVANSAIVATGTTTTRTVTVTPLPDAIGSTTITLTLSDGALQATTTIPLTVNFVNDPPAAFDATFEVGASQALSGFLTGFDPDVGQTLTATIDAGPSNGTLTNFVASTGAFTYTPTPGFTGLDSFTWHLTDNFSSPASSTTARATMVVMADPSQPRPRITSEPSAEVVLQGGGTWTYTPTVSHTSATTLTVTAPATVVSGTQISWPIAAPPSGNHISFIIVARDSVTGALDYQQIILRYVPTGAPN